MADHKHIEEVEQQAMLYSLGALTPEEAKKFAQRLAADCPLCRAEVGECRQVLGALAMTAPQVEPPPNARDRLLAAIGAAAKPEGSQKEAAGKDASTSMGEGLIVRKDASGFESSPMPGVQIRNLLGKKTFLVRMEPKSYLPEHQHKAAEQCLVLEGSISSDGITAYAGDYTFMPAGSNHNPLYSETGCLLLIAYT
jgi:anti-sigma factor ChrR (cupin superfamily)